MTEYKLITIINKITKIIISPSLKYVLQKLNNNICKLDNINTYIGSIDIFDYFPQKNDIILSWLDNKDNAIALVSEIDIKKKLFIHISYLIWPTYMNHKELMRPHYLLDAIFKHKLSNLVILFDYLDINPEYLYQTYILYLNKTISKLDTIQNTDIKKIIYTFIKSTINTELYEKLLLFYLKERNILPFMMKYDIDGLKN